jgi:hypothetical protein
MFFLSFLRKAFFPFPAPFAAFAIFQSEQ